MIKIIEKRSYYTGEEVDGKGVLRAELIADTAAELAGVTEVGGNVLDFGSIALTADGKALMLDSKGVWRDRTDGIRPSDTSSWYGIRNIVRAGLASRFFQVGDMLTCKRGNDTIIWDIVNITDHDMTLMSHNILEVMQAGAKQAIFAFPNGASAGSYHFTYNNKSFMFTLLQDIPAKGQLVFDSSIAAGNTISAYANGSSTAAIETVEMSNGNDGADLGTLTAAGDAANNINATSRSLQGSNNYKFSAIRQWLNSNRTAGNVYTPQTPFDRPPDWSGTMNGFMYDLEPEFISCVAPTTYTTANNTQCDGGGGYALTDKFYLASKVETTGAEETGDYSEGAKFQYYSEGVGADVLRVKNYNGSPMQWRLRTPYLLYSYNLRYFNAGGAYANYFDVMQPLGVVPVCRIG